MKQATRGRPRTSNLTRAEQLRAAKRMQRQRERRAGLAAVQLRLPATQAARLRIAAGTPGFDRRLEQFLDELVLDIDRWPALRELAWNRSDRWIPAQEALALYERNWRLVDPARLTPDERQLIEHLQQRFGNDILNA